MAIVPMKFVSACTDREHLDEMLLKVRSCGLLHPVSASEIVTEDNGGRLLNEDNPYSGYRQTIRNLAHSIGCDLKEKGTPSKTYTKEEIEAFISEITEKFGITTDSNEVLLTPDDEAALKELSKCGFERIHACRYLNFGFGRLPADSFQKLSMYGQEYFVHHRCHATDQYIWMVYVTSDSYAQKVKKIFQELYFEPIDIPSVDVHRLMEDYRDRINDVYAYCNREDEICSMYPDVAVLDEKMILSGFIQADEADAFKNVFVDLPVDFRFKEPSEMPQCKCPTVLKNNWFARPFELFVEMYSLPQYGDFDPTFFMALTYCLLFGIMFGDMGQGLVLMAIGFAFEKKGKLFGIIGRVGITSTVFGFLFGSLFGYEDALNPIHQKLFHVREKLFDVMANSNTMFLLIGAIAIGAVLIMITQLINITNNMKKKKYGEVLFSQNGVAGLVFYGSIMFAVVYDKLVGVNIAKNPLYIAICFVLPVLCFIMKEPFSNAVEHRTVKPKEGWGGYVTQSIFEMIEILLSFVTNSMSYLRVGGFVLSHAGMMLVVMTLVKMTGGAGPVVLIIGNAFVMILEGLIVGIQTLRLEYYEMFSRYYTGGGVRFKAMQTD